MSCGCITVRQEMEDGHVYDREAPLIDGSKVTIWEWTPGPKIHRSNMIGGPEWYGTLRLRMRSGFTDDEVRSILRENLEDRAGIN